MRSPARLMTAVLAAASCLPAQDAGEILRQTAETYRNLKSYHFELVTDTETVGELSQVRLKLIQSLAAEDPGRVRAEIRHRGMWQVAISDGRTGWQYDPGFREFARKEGLALESAGPGRPDLADPALQFLQRTLQGHLARIDKSLRSAEILREEPLEIDGAQPLCWVIQAEYEPGDRLALSKQDSRTYWIDKVRKLVLREERRSRGSYIGSEDYEDQERSSTTVFRLARVNTSLPDALFTFDPPPDAVEVGTLPEPGRRRDNLRGQPAPDFSLPTLSGAELKLSSLRGQVVLLDFWSTSCGACRAQMPELKALHEETKDRGVALIGVNSDEDKQLAIDYLSQQGYQWPNVWDERNSAWRAYRIHAQPTVVVIQPDGIVFEQAVGYGNPTLESVRSALRRLGIEVTPPPPASVP